MKINTIQATKQIMHATNAYSNFSDRRKAVNPILFRIKREYQDLSRGWLWDALDAKFERGEEPDWISLAEAYTDIQKFYLKMQGATGLYKIAEYTSAFMPLYEDKQQVDLNSKSEIQAWLRSK
jgi:hypothetical protein